MFSYQRDQIYLIDASIVYNRDSHFLMILIKQELLGAAIVKSECF